MPDHELLELMKRAARDAAAYLREQPDSVKREYRYSPTVSREMKGAVDGIMEEKVLGMLAPAGLPVLSEESAAEEAAGDDGLRFVVDPLDGTVNYVRGLGPASVSIALCRGYEPVYGVVATYPGGDVAFGGKGEDAYLNSRPIRVSEVARAEEAVLCTGIPARLSLDDDRRRDGFVRSLMRYGKVRMLGAASISLLQVAKGSAEVYVENDIMLWDVAAGLAIVEGAGGVTRLENGTHPNAVNAHASNGRFEC